jgi:hypothetical protein
MIPKSGNRFPKRSCSNNKLERMTIRRKVIPLWSTAFALLVHLVPIFLAAAAVLSMPARAIDHGQARGLDPRPTLARKRGRVGRGDGAVADYRDGRDKPGETKWELPRVLPL